MSTFFYTYASILFLVALFLTIRYYTMDYKSKAKQKANQFNEK